MVDPHQVLIDNGNNSSKITESPNLPADLIQMNNSDPIKHPNQQLKPDSEVNSVVSDAFEVNTVSENRQNVYRKLETFDEIMCGPSARISTNSTIQSNDHNNSENENAILIAQNGDNSSLLISNNISRDIESINVSPNKDCVIVDTNKQTRESNDSHNKQSVPSKTINNSADSEKQAEFIQPNTSIALDKNQVDTTVSISTNKMDSRKVEPLRININRDPIKTKIKLGTSGDRQSLSPKSSSSSNAGNDECDDASELSHENQQSYPKITIKPIVKPPIESERHHNHSTVSHTPSSSQEAIPKLKIKKVDSNNSNSSLTPIPTHLAASNSDDVSGNYQTHLLPESSPSVPK